MIDFICDDVLHWAKNYNGPKFHAALLDGPYHLNFMSKKWDASGPDAICFQKETWEALSKHLHDGAFVMAFSGARTYHRMASAIEDAGFVLHSMIGWTYGSGFPKATRVKGSEIFDGHRYGLQALKPAMEPICVAQKPYKGKPVDCIVETGAGALNIDAGRISSVDNLARLNHDGDNGWSNSSGGPTEAARREAEGLPQLGRWPANFILSCSPLCTDDQHHESCAVSVLGEQSGEARSSMYVHRSESKNNRGGVQFSSGKGYAEPGINTYNDTGTAARYFANTDFSLDQQEAIDNADPFFYCAKASRRERDAGLEDMPLRNGMSLDVVDNGGTAAIGNHNPVCQKCGFSKINRGNGKCECESPEWKAVNNQVRNPHPTVKPLKLARYLASLLLPPDAYAPRRILNPFGGSMSEAIGAYLAGFEEIVTIEREQEYVEIGKKRAAYWQTAKQKY